MNMNRVLLNLQNVRQTQSELRYYIVVKDDNLVVERVSDDGGKILRVGLTPVLSWAERFQNREYALKVAQFIGGQAYEVKEEVLFIKTHWEVDPET